ncbi:unnamed protein product [Rangifer tarandus platyrhynchus]|uniref:Uncharacterized protein n=1 Tax=Rangifer tarandus platyrhynchus TaxID=3082113 RepID=A0AC59Z6U9_RANTA
MGKLGLRVTEPGAHNLCLQTLSPALPHIVPAHHEPRSQLVRVPSQNPSHHARVGGLQRDRCRGGKQGLAGPRQVYHFFHLFVHPFIHSFIHHHGDATSDQGSQGISAAGQGLSTGDNLPEAKAQSFPDPKVFPGPGLETALKAGCCPLVASVHLRPT